MSQRSHIAHSGRSAISECSAACSEPSSRGICFEALEHPRLGEEPDRLGLELGLRQLERDELEALLRLDRLLLVADDLLGDDDARRRRARARAGGPTRRGSTIAVVVSFFACV